MKIRMLLLTMFIAAITTILNCGSNVATSNSTITVNPSTITITDQTDPYVDRYLKTLVTSPGSSTSSAIPMNDIKVTYNAGGAVGQQFSGTGYFAFVDSSGNICPSPCQDTTNNEGISTMKVRFCTTVDCYQVTNIQIPSALMGLPSASPITLTTTIYVSSGSATPASVSVSVN